jgi:hypothetical protein
MMGECTVQATTIGNVQLAWPKGAPRVSVAELQPLASHADGLALSRGVLDGSPITKVSVGISAVAGAVIVGMATASLSGPAAMVAGAIQGGVAGGVVGAVSGGLLGSVLCKGKKPFACVLTGAIAGGVLGAGGGALLGSQVGAAFGNILGFATGAVAGGLVGYVLGRGIEGILK